MSGRIDGSVILISGAARGQGAAEARRFVHEGARVVIGDVLGRELEAVAAELGDAAVPAALDVSDQDAWEAAVGLAVSRFGRLDALVNNAGIHWARPLLEETVADLDRMLSVDLRGAFLGIRTAAPAIAQSGGGAIVNVSSTAGFVGYPERGAYGMAKWGCAA
jgi:3alpha(or 20beta)-hydroxysteroid dehydrogenase